MKPVIFFGILNDDTTKIIVCFHFGLLQDYIYRTEMKLSLLIKSDKLICIRIFAFPIGIIEFSTTRK